MSSIFLGSGTVLAETSNKIILKQYHGKLQVKPFQCDSFKSNDKTETFLQEKKLNSIFFAYVYRIQGDRAF